jgi:hypothetical protein
MGSADQKGASATAGAATSIELTSSAAARNIPETLETIFFLNLKLTG